MVHDLVAVAERTDVTADYLDASLERYSDRLVFEIAERRAALMHPPPLTGSHSAELGAAIANAQQWLRELSHASTVEQEAVIERLHRERDAFLSTFDSAATELREAIAQSRASRWLLRRWAVDRANEIAAARVRGWIEAVASRSEAMHADAVDRYARATQELVDRIQAAGVKIDEDVAVDASYVSPDPQSAAVTVRPPFGWRSLLNAIAGSSDRNAALTEAAVILREAMESGSAQIVNALRDTLLLARRRFEWEIALRLRATADALRRASESARSTQLEGATGIANELNRLDDLAKKVERLRR
jgi:hypothetical protein